MASPRLILATVIGLLAGREVAGVSLGEVAEDHVGAGATDG
jgi:hypothetical protein